ncbi:MAG: hypothetical protein WKF60_12495 [Ilumatobacter sp.]
MSDTAVTPTNDAPDLPVPHLAAPTAPNLPPHPDTAVPTVSPGAPVEGDLPRLGSGPITSPSPSATPTLPSTATPTLPSTATPTPPSTTPTPGPDPMASLPAVSADSAPRPDRFPVDAPIDVATLANLPKLPQASPAVSVFETEDGITKVGPAPAAPTGEHPMAHLMPARSKPTQASINAAEARAAKKAKTKKVKILVVVGALVVSALVGPPFVSWLTGAINEAGNTNTGTGE